jgi:epoxyqueuosine reductase
VTIRESLNGISRRTFVKVAASASAVAVAAPVAVSVARRSKEVEIEQRIREFLEAQLKTASHFVWEAGGSPAQHFGNTLRYSPVNDANEFDNVRMFDAPVVAFASATDPLFDELKKSDVVGPNHMSPKEWMPDAKTVISYFYPFTEEIRSGNRKAGLPSKEWLAGKAAAEVFVYNTGGALTQFLAGRGASAVVPDTDHRFKMVRNGTIAIPSWSERHVGYVAGLGTFGLHKSLITERGSAGRLGSLITNLELTPTVRKYKGKNDYCPYYVNGSCVACIERCPAHAVNKTGGDQVTACSKYTKEVVGPSIAPTPYKNGCGKCQTAVPCEIGIPAGIKLSV